MNRLVKSTIFIILGISMLLGLQRVLTPNMSKLNANVGYTVKGIRAIDEDSIDILFLGVSLAHLGISPLYLYENTGICSYNLGTPNQPMAGSYYLLQEAFKKQTPTVVTLEVTKLYSNSTQDNLIDEGYRYILDSVPLSINKLDMAKSYEESVEDGNTLNVLFPILKYHSRWDELTSDDFIANVGEGDNYYSAGQFLWSAVVAMTVGFEEADAQVEGLLNLPIGQMNYYEDGRSGKEVITEPVYETENITEFNLDVLRKIKQLCADHGAQLLLIKMPTCSFPQFVDRVWNRQKYCAVKDLSEELGVPYLDLNYDVETGIDFSTDTGDSGVHLNVRGAEKITRVLGRYLLEHYPLKARDDAQFNENLIKYKKVREVAFLQSEIELDAYLKRLIENKDTWTICIAANDDYTNGLDTRDHSLLNELGLQLASEGEFQDSYVAVIEDGVVRYEAVSDRRIDYSTSLNTYSISLSSSGWRTTPDSSIVVNAQEYGVNGRGLNIVVFDNESSVVIDSVAFDTWQESKPAVREWEKISEYLRAYESIVCFEKDMA